MRPANRLLAPLVALALVVGAVLLAIEVVAAGLGKEPVVVGWHGTYAAGRRDVWSTGGPITICVLLVVVGLVLLLLQAKRRRVTDRPLEEITPGVTATLSTAALRTTLRVAAAEVDGIAAAHATVGRRGATVSATSRGADPTFADRLREPAQQAVADRLAGTGLQHPPRLDVSVTAGKAHR